VALAVPKCLRVVALTFWLAPVTVVAQSSELHGRVLATDGQPVPGATVSLTSVGFSVRTDSLGRFRLTGTPGSTLSLAISGAGFRRSEVQVILVRGRNMTRDFVLEWESTSRVGVNPSELLLSGRVTDPDGGPLAYANLHLSGGRPLIADDSGRFTIPKPIGAGARLIVRRIGFEPVEVELAASVDTALRIVMQPIATALPETKVVGRSPFRSLEFGGFYRRMSDNEKGIVRGWFITPEDLELRKPSTVTTAVADLPNIRIRRAPKPWDEKSSLSVEHLLYRVEDSRGCPLTVYVDRMRITPILVRGELRDEFINTLIVPTSLAGIEVYPRALGAPRDFSMVDGTCGIVILWTR
jgi:hypothetical protein